MCILEKVLEKATFNKMIVFPQPTNGCWAWIDSTQGNFFTFFFRGGGVIMCVLDIVLNKTTLGKMIH